MLRHPFFPDILMHSDEALAQALGVGIVERTTIHEWPLSCVQRLVLEDGAKLIYKAQIPPTVEPQFYQAAASALLPGYQVLGQWDQCSIMTFEWIEAPLLNAVAGSDDELVAHGRRVTAQISEISGALPVYLDIGSTEGWLSAAEIMVAKLRELVEDQRFTSIDPGAVERVWQWANAARVIDVVTEHPRLIHGDLLADQIFVIPGGYRVIDWQRPMIAPPEVDLAALLVGQGIDPQHYLTTTQAAIFWFLRLHWAVVAQYDLFPELRGSGFDQWASEATGHILEDAGNYR